MHKQAAGTTGSRGSARRANARRRGRRRSPARACTGRAVRPPPERHSDAHAHPRALSLARTRARTSARSQTHTQARALAHTLGTLAAGAMPCVPSARPVRLDRAEGAAASGCPKTKRGSRGCGRRRSGLFAGSGRGCTVCVRLQPTPWHGRKRKAALSLKPAQPGACTPNRGGLEALDAFERKVVRARRSAHACSGRELNPLCWALTPKP